MFLLVGKGHTSNSENEGWLMDKRAERVKGAVRGSIEHEFTNTWWGLKGVGGALVYCIKGFSFGKLLD